MAFDAAIVAIAAFGAYEQYDQGKKQSEAINAATKAPKPQLHPQADTSGLDDQRRKRATGADGRDQTILAPPGSLLGLPGPGAGGPPPKTQLGT